jgi:hypothetical protein
MVFVFSVAKVVVRADMVLAALLTKCGGLCCLFFAMPAALAPKHGSESVVVVQFSLAPLRGYIGLSATVGDVTGRPVIGCQVAEVKYLEIGEG